MSNKYKQTIKIPCYDTDKSLRIKPASFLNYAQEMAGEHAEILGFGVAPLLEKNLVWVVSRMRVQFDRMPLWRDTIEITTWHRGLVGPFFVREFVIHSKDGEFLGKATSSWILLNLETRTMSREAEIANGPETITDESVMEVCGRLRLPRDIETTSAGSHTVGYSDVDKNGHANNVMYTVWAMDTLDRQFLDENPVKDLEINFISEAHPGDSVDLFKGCRTGEDGDLQWYVVGKVAGADSFIVRFTF